MTAWPLPGASSPCPSLNTGTQAEPHPTWVPSHLHPAAPQESVPPAVESPEHEGCVRQGLSPLGRHTCGHPCESPSGARTHSSGDGQEAVVADEHDVEDGRGAQQVVHHQPQLAETPAEGPAAGQHIGHIQWDAEGTCGGAGRQWAQVGATQGPRASFLGPATCLQTRLSGIAWAQLHSCC